MIRNGLQWKDAPRGYSRHTTLYSRFARWSRLSVFGRILPALVAQAGMPKLLMIDKTHLKAPHSRQLGRKEAAPRCIGRTRSGLNSKLRAVCDEKGGLVRLL